MNSEMYYRAAFSIKDNLDADYFKGVCYAFGYTVPPDSTKAKAAYVEGVKNGNAKCKYGLAVLLIKSKIDSDVEAAQDLFREAFEELYKQASLDDPISQRMISCYYLFGDRGVSTDTEEAGKWLLKAAQHGDAEAQMNLAHCYETGTVFCADVGLALEWYTRSAMQGNVKASQKLAELRRNGNEQIHV